MNRHQLTRNVLSRGFPNECDAVGPSVVDDIVDGVEIVAPEEGRPFPLHDVLQTLKDVIQIIAALIPIIAFLWQRLKRKPRMPEVEEEMRKRKTSAGSLSEAEVKKAVKETLDAIKDLQSLASITGEAS